MPGAALTTVRLPGAAGDGDSVAVSVPLFPTATLMGLGSNVVGLGIAPPTVAPKRAARWVASK